MRKKNSSLDQSDPSNVKMDNAFTAQTNMGGPGEPMYSGVASFWRRRLTKDLKGVDIAVTGIPLDLTTTGRPGARLGPRAVRNASSFMSWGVPFSMGYDVLKHLNVIDYGDCFFDSGIAGDFVDKIYQHTLTILQHGVKPLSIGGDHFMLYPILRAVSEVHGPVALIHFDAHPDNWSEDIERLDHGSMLYHAIRKNYIQPTKSIQIGIRTFNKETFGMKVLTAPMVHRLSVESIIQTIQETVGNEKVYLTFDVDCLDPAHAPGTGTPVVGGLTSLQALEILRGLQVNCVGMEVVEVSPSYDPSEITALVAAQVGIELICMVERYKKNIRYNYQQVSHNYNPNPES